MTDIEKAALERRIDELCAEVEALKRDEWAAGFNAGCDAVEAAYEDGRPFYEVENAKLRDENARLRSCLSDDVDNARKIMAENAALRELVRDFASYRHFDCRHCGYKEQCKTRRTNCYKVFVGLFNRTRELGIEVYE